MESQTRQDAEKLNECGLLLFEKLSTILNKYSGQISDTAASAEFRRDIADLIATLDTGLLGTLYHRHPDLDRVRRD